MVPSLCSAAVSHSLSSEHTWGHQGSEPLLLPVLPSFSSDARSRTQRVAAGPYPPASRLRSLCNGSTAQALRTRQIQAGGWGHLALLIGSTIGSPGSRAEGSPHVGPKLAPTVSQNSWEARQSLEWRLFTPPPQKPFQCPGLCRQGKKASKTRTAADSVWKTHEPPGDSG